MARLSKRRQWKRKLCCNRPQITWTKIDVRDSLAPLLFFAETETQGTGYGLTTEHGCLRRTHPLIKISRAALNIQARQPGSFREVYLRNGSVSQQHRCCGSMGNVRPSLLVSSQMLITSNYSSGLREEYPLVRYHFSVHS